jgi:WhiB family transcriptional regulator, redox-sensing transcriptional regulator
VISSKHLPGLEPAGTWHSRALCRPDNPGGHDPELWHAHPLTQARDLKEAKEVCARCPVLGECREDALRIEAGKGPTSRYGIRAGLTGRERYRLARQRAGRSP